MFFISKKGLFSRVILLSGSALSPWAIVRDPEYYARQLGQQLNCTNLVSEFFFLHPRTLVQLKWSPNYQLPLPNPSQESMIECVRTRKVSELLSVPLSVPAHLSGVGPIVDSIVVPADPRRLYHTDLFRWGGGEHNQTYSSSPLATHLLANSAEQQQYDLLLGTTDADAPSGMFNEDELSGGMRPDRRDRLLRTLVQNLYDYHQQVCTCVIVTSENGQL